MITVLMPLYNGAPFVRQAVESILAQSFRDFELLIIDDGSSDQGPEIVAGIDDERIVLVRNQHNMGVAASLNRGLTMARRNLVARMDADDISLPDRLERQLQFMDAHPEVGISGGWVRLFGGDELPNICRVPGASNEVAVYMLFENPLWHMTVMMRKEMMQLYDLQYNKEFTRSEDYDLWIRAGHCFPLANVEEVLVRVRRTPGSATRANWDEMTRQTETLLGRQLFEFGISATAEEIAFHHRVGRGYRMTSCEQIKLAESWLCRLLSENRQRRVFDQLAMRRIVGLVWFRLCANATPLGFWIWRTWRNSSLGVDAIIPVSEKFRLITSIVWHLTRKTNRAKG